MQSAQTKDYILVRHTQDTILASYLSRITAKHPRNIDKDLYNERHLVENLFLEMKNNRRFATRYEKKAVFFRLFLSLLAFSFAYFDGLKTDSRLIMREYCHRLY